METSGNKPVYLQPECTLMELDRKHKTHIQRKLNSTLMTFWWDQQKHAQKVGKQIPGT
jgi:hypothetical protein